MDKKMAAAAVALLLNSFRINLIEAKLKAGLGYRDR